ncbi:MAG: ATP-binding protein [Bacteroidales bacterium]|jgi:serine/threonine-protein kinase RsbW|nr:ATP-binding protein [Bacteroidales bacterium]
MFYLQMSLQSDLSKLSEIDFFLENIIQQFEIKDDFFGILNVPLNECVKNAIIHGNGCNPDKKVLIEVYVEQSKLFFSITDEGVGFDYNSFLQQSVECLKNNGLFLVEMLTENLSFAKDGAQVSYEIEVPFSFSAGDKRVDILQQSQVRVENSKAKI